MSATATTTRERPVIFSGDSVRAILAGAKTQTRRLKGLDAINESPGLWRFAHMKDGAAVFHGPGPCRSMTGVRCPYGAPGDRLWVRETFAKRSDVDPEKSPEKARHYVVYRADREAGDDLSMDWHHYGGWRSSIHMPRWASRLTLEIVSVRVERLHEITEADVLAEGIDPIHIEKNRKFFHANDCPGLAFGEHWNRINGKTHPWASNPWVFVVAFSTTLDPRSRT